MEEDTKFLAENFHIHDASVPNWLEWLQILTCSVCRYQRKHMNIFFREQIK